MQLALINWHTEKICLDFGALKVVIKVTANSKSFTKTFKCKVVLPFVTLQPAGLYLITKNLGTITPYEQNKSGPQYRYGLMVCQIEEIGLSVMELELHNFENNITDLQWYGMDWGALTPSEDDLSLLQVEDLSSPLHVEAYDRLNH